MKVLTPAALLLSTSLACATTHEGRAIQLVVASDAAADTAAAGYADFRDGMQAKCNAKLDPEVNTKSDAKECMGLASSDNGKKFLKIVEVIVAAQLAIKIAVECDTNPLKLPVEFREQCIDAKAADWKALAATLTSAWDQLRPFYLAIAGSK
jgi:hypothetical protein